MTSDGEVLSILDHGLAPVQRVGVICEVGFHVGQSVGRFGGAECEKGASRDGAGFIISACERLRASE